jgi:hypothetical protein
LEAIALDESRLHRVETGSGSCGFGVRGLGSKALDCGDAVSVLRDREGEARIYPGAVYDYGACAALAVVAALFGAGQLEAFPQEVEQGDAGIEIELLALSINGEGTVN